MSDNCLLPLTVILTQPTCDAVAASNVSCNSYAIKLSNKFQYERIIFVVTFHFVQTVKSRRMRIEVAESDSDRRGRGGRDRGEMNRDRPDGPDRTMGDWRSRPREEQLPEPDSDRSFGRDRDSKLKLFIYRNVLMLSKTVCNIFHWLA